MEKESGELRSLRYMFPAASCCAQGAIEQEERLRFINLLRNGGMPSRKRLEELFPEAVIHYHGDWSTENVGRYWLQEHNKIVADNPACKIYCFTAAGIYPGQENEECRVSVGFGYQFPSYILLSKGDIFTVHNLVVAEKISKADAIKYFGGPRK